MTRAEHHGYDEHDAFLCACKGLPYTLQEWEREVDRLRNKLDDARQRLQRARAHGGVCLPARFDQASVRIARTGTSITEQEDERLLEELERAEEFLHDVGCGDGAIAVHEAISRLQRIAKPTREEERACE